MTQQPNMVTPQGKQNSGATHDVDTFLKTAPKPIRTQLERYTAGGLDLTKLNPETERVLVSAIRQGVPQKVKDALSKAWNEQQQRETKKPQPLPKEMAETITEIARLETDYLEAAGALLAKLKTYEDEPGFIRYLAKRFGILEPEARIKYSSIEGTSDDAREKAVGTQMVYLLDYGIERKGMEGELGQCIKRIQEIKPRLNELLKKVGIAQTDIVLHAVGAAVFGTRPMTMSITGNTVLSPVEVYNNCIMIDRYMAPLYAMLNPSPIQPNQLQQLMNEFNKIAISNPGNINMMYPDPKVRKMVLEVAAQYLKEDQKVAFKKMYGV